MGCSVVEAGGVRNRQDPSGQVVGAFPAL